MGRSSRPRRAATRGRDPWPGIASRRDRHPHCNPIVDDRRPQRDALGIDGHPILDRRRAGEHQPRRRRSA